MFEIEEDFEGLMNGIVYRHLKSRTTHNEISSYAFDYSKWPECTAKTVVNDLYGALPKGYDYARAMTAEKHRDYLQLLNDRSLPKSLDLVGEKLSGHLKTYWQIKFARDVAAHPDHLDQLIQQYQADKPNGTQLYSLTDELPNLLKAHLAKLQAGEASIIIPDFPVLSDYVGGFNGGRLTLLTGKTGFGKTNLSISLAMSACKAFRTLYFNMEMSKEDFGARFIHNGADIDNKEWRKGTFLGNKAAEERIFKYLNDQATRKDIKFTGGKSLTMEEIKTTIYSMFDGTDFGIVIIDYDQKILLKNKTEEWRELVDVVSELEEIAKRTNTHIILLSQANDDGRSRASIRMEQGASSVLTFSKVSNPINPILDKYFVKGFKTRYSGPEVVELSVDLARSKVVEVGYMQQPKFQSKGKHDF